MFNLRSVFAFWAVAALVLGSAERAQAQTTGNVSVAVPATGVRRDHQDYAGKVLVTQINYKDCLNEDFFTFTVNLGTGFMGHTLEIWAGTSCDGIPNRQPNTATCWQVSSIVPASINLTMKATVREMLYGLTGNHNIGNGSSGSNGGTGGTDATGGTGDTSASGGSAGDSSGGGGGSGSGSVPSDAPPECTPTSAAVGAQPITLYFLLLQPGMMADASATWKGTYKLIAPDPPTGVTSGTGENQAPIFWSPQTNQADQTIDGYQFYCDPAPGQAGLDEAGVPPPDPGILPAACTATEILKEGARPDDKYKCGTAAKTATRGTATGLINNVAYNVAVAATDTYRNVGVVSEPACAIPQPVTGFFEAYRDAGGAGGGGFCSFSRQRRPLILLGVIGLGLCLVLRRRRAT
jgi:hypothetical protein